MDVLKQLATYLVILILIWAGFTYFPRLARVQLPADYTEIYVPGVEEYKSYSLDSGATIPKLRVGDAVCYRVAKGEDAQSNGFGFVAALPGDTVRFVKGALQVNGVADKHSGLTQLADAGPLMVPENHVYVVTDGHATDSVARGPIPAAALRGRIADFP